MAHGDWPKVVKAQSTFYSTANLLFKLELW
jgi:hypothetical protein